MPLKARVKILLLEVARNYCLTHVCLPLGIQVRGPVDLNSWGMVYSRASSDLRQVSSTDMRVMFSCRHDPDCGNCRQPVDQTSLACEPHFLLLPIAESKAGRSTEVEGVWSYSS